MDYVVEVILEVWRNRLRLGGLKLTYEAPFLRHFTARLAPVARAGAS
jgi:tryptophanase